MASRAFSKCGSSTQKDVRDCLFALGWAVYITSCHLLAPCSHILNTAGLTTCLYVRGSHWYPVWYKYASDEYKVNFLRHLSLLMIGCDSECKDYDVILLG